MTTTPTPPPVKPAPPLIGSFPVLSDDMDAEQKIRFRAVDMILARRTTWDLEDVLATADYIATGDLDDDTDEEES